MTNKTNINFEFEDGVSVSSSDYWYDLNEGYINLEELLKSKEQADKVYEAISIINAFFTQAEEKGAIKEM